MAATNPRPHGHGGTDRCTGDVDTQRYVTDVETGELVDMHDADGYPVGVGDLVERSESHANGPAIFEGVHERRLFEEAMEWLERAPPSIDCARGF